MFNEITEMSDKEAAAILKAVQRHGNINMGRGNLKSMRLLKINMAFAKAIEKLEQDD